MPHELHGLCFVLRLAAGVLAPPVSCVRGGMVGSASPSWPMRFTGFDNTGSTLGHLALRRVPSVEGADAVGTARSFLWLAC